MQSRISFSHEDGSKAMMPYLCGYCGWASMIIRVFPFEYFGTRFWPTVLHNWQRHGTLVSASPTNGWKWQVLIDCLIKIFICEEVVVKGREQQDGWMSMAQNVVAMDLQNVYHSCIFSQFSHPICWSSQCGGLVIFGTQSISSFGHLDPYPDHATPEGADYHFSASGIFHCPNASSQDTCHKDREAEIAFGLQ